MLTGRKSLRIAQIVVYLQVDDDVLDRSKLSAATHVIEQQIAKAGIRLPEVLNRAFAVYPSRP
jgi:hypothetical protein